MKRRAIKVFGLLLLGAIINVAVAWACVLIFSHSDDSVVRPPSTSEKRWIESHQESWGPELVVDTGFGIQCIGGTLEDPVFYDWLRKFMNDGGHVTFVPSAAYIFSAGIPFYSVSSYHLVHSQTWREASIAHLAAPAGFVTGGFRLPPRQDYDRTPRSLAWIPLWPGFVFNSLFYAMLIWWLLAVLRNSWHRRRLKQGLCPICAFPIGSSNVCTECGRLLSSSSTSRRPN